MRPRDRIGYGEEGHSVLAAELLFRISRCCCRSKSSRVLWHALGNVRCWCPMNSAAHRKLSQYASSSNRRFVCGFSNQAGRIFTNGCPSSSCKACRMTFSREWGLRSTQWRDCERKLPDPRWYRGGRRSSLFAVACSPACVRRIGAALLMLGASMHSSTFQLLFHSFKHNFTPFLKCLPYGDCWSRAATHRPFWQLSSFAVY